MPTDPSFPPDDDLDDEPMSIAEEIAAEVKLEGEDATDRYESLKKTDTHITALQKMSMQELIELARQEQIGDITGAKKHDLVFRILKERVKLNGLMFGEGTLEILPDGFGFLRSPDYHYLSCPDDIYVSPSQIRRFGLRNGASVAGQIRPPKESERYFALLRVEAINGEDPAKLSTRVYFDDLTPLHPDRRITMETTPEEIAMRVVDLVVPIGFGQRGLIVSPPRAGKTILLQKMAKSVLANYPEAYVFMLLIDERPEEVTDMRMNVKRGEVIASSLDEDVDSHVRLSQLVIDRCRRLAEMGKDVFLLMDSITRLARAFNKWVGNSGPTMSGGVNIKAMDIPKKLFATARAFAEGGSLTIVGTALVDTGSRMDELIFQEFKGTGNMELVLDRKLADRRIWPAIDITQSGTRREELLHDPDTYHSVTMIRRTLNSMNPVEAMEQLTKQLGRFASNQEFLKLISNAKIND